MPVSLFPVCLFQRFQTDLSNQVDKSAFRLLFWLPGIHFDRTQVIGNLILQIHLPDLPYPLDRQRILLIAVRQHIPHQILKNVFFDQTGGPLGNLQRFRVVGEVLQSVKIGIQLVIQTSFQPAALSA